MNKQIILIDAESSNGINCISDHPLQSPAENIDLEYQELSRNQFCKFNKCIRSEQLYYLDTHAPITRCHDKSENSQCGLQVFLKQPEILPKIEELVKQAKSKGFSLKFRSKAKNKKFIELLRNIDDPSKTDYSFLKGRECFRYFTDLLILLQCPDNAVFLTYDDDFVELGEMINRPSITLNPNKYERAK